MQKRVLDVRSIRILVFDEADEMLKVRGGGGGVGFVYVCVCVCARVVVVHVCALCAHPSRLCASVREGWGVMVQPMHTPTHPTAAAARRVCRRHGAHDQAAARRQPADSGGRAVLRCAALCWNDLTPYPGMGRSGSSCLNRMRPCCVLACVTQRILVSSRV